MAFLQFICVFLSYFINFRTSMGVFFELNPFIYVCIGKNNSLAIFRHSLLPSNCFYLLHRIPFIVRINLSVDFVFNISIKMNLAYWLATFRRIWICFIFSLALTCCCQTKLASHISKLSNGFFFVAQSFPPSHQFVELKFEKECSSLMFLMLY